MAIWTLQDRIVVSRAFTLSLYLIFMLPILTFGLTYFYLSVSSKSSYLILVLALYLILELDPCTWPCILSLILYIILILDPCTWSCILSLYSILVPDSGFSSHWLFSSLSGPCRSVQIPALEPRRLNAPLCRYRRTRHELLTSSRSRQRNPGRLGAALLFSRWKINLWFLGSPVCTLGKGEMAPTVADRWRKRAVEVARQHWGEHSPTSASPYNHR